MKVGKEKTERWELIDHFVVIRADHHDTGSLEIIPTVLKGREKEPEKSIHTRDGIRPNRIVIVGMPKIADGETLEGTMPIVHIPKKGQGTHGQERISEPSR